MILSIAGILIALAYLLELIRFASGLGGLSVPAPVGALSFCLFFTGAALTFSKAVTPEDEALKSALDKCIILSGIGLTMQALAVSLFFDVATAAPVASGAVSVAVIIAGLWAIAVLAKGLFIRFAVR
jgi:hypothetical protein